MSNNNSIDNINNLINTLNTCIEKLEVYNYVYNSYSPKYIDNDMKTYSHSKTMMIELGLLDIETYIDELYNELEISILDKAEIIEAEIAEMKEKEKKAKEIYNKAMPYLLHLNMLMDKDSIYYSKNSKEISEEEINNLKKEYNIN